MNRVLAGSLVILCATACNAPEARIAYDPVPKFAASIPTSTTTSTLRVRASRSRPTTGVQRTHAPVVVGDLSALLDKLAMCESGMNPRANTGNGFYGAFQWMLSTWRGMGMSGNPIDYSYAEQKAVAARIPVSAWHRQFPVCSRRIGV